MSKSPKQTSKWKDFYTFHILLPVLLSLVKILVFSYRLVKAEGLESEKEATQKSGGKVIYCSWHQRLIYHPYFLKKRGITVMVSQSRDGEFAARFINAFGLGDVRGSSTRGGLGALIKLTQKIRKKECNGGMVVDGPVGPARVAKMGAIMLAKKSKVPLIPITWGADRCWVLNSWDRFIVPKPFAKIVYSLGEPLWVPEDADEEKQENLRKQLEERLNNEAKWCDEQLGKELPWRKVKEEGIPETGPLDSMS